MDVDVSGTGTGPAEESPRTGGAQPAEPTIPAEPTKPAKPAKGGGSLWHELPVLVLIALALAILLKTFLVQAFYIPSGSMENTLQVGDRVMVNKVVYHLRDIKRGDIVVFDGLDSFTPEVTITEPTNPVS